MSLCGVCYLWKNGFCYEFERKYDFDKNMNCILFDLSIKARKILLEHRKELEGEE